MFLEGRHQFDFLIGEIVRPLPGDALEQLWKGEDSLIRSMLINRLNPKFDTVCGRVLGQRPLPSLMEVCFEVHLEEDRTNAIGVLTTPTIDSTVFNTRSSNHDGDKNNGKSIPMCEHCKKQWHTKDQCWKLHGCPPGCKKRSSHEKQNSRRAYISETILASTSQSTDPTASQTKTSTLGAIAQSGMPQSLGLISVDGKNPWILDSGATDHLTGSSEHFISYAPCVGNEKIQIADGSLAPIAGKGQIVPFDCFTLQNILHDMSSGRMIGTTRHSRELYSLDDDTSCSSLSKFPGKTYYKRNLRKEVGSLTSQPPTPVQDFEPLRDQGMENPTEPCTNNTMSENDRSDVAVLENMEEKNHGDEIEVRIKTSNDEAEQGHTRKHDEYDPSLDIPIALRKDGTLNRHKARLVVKGFTQTYGIDYSETFSPVAKLNTVRVLLSVAVNKDWPLYQLDVKNAFLNGDLVEEVYMSPLPEFEAQFGQQVCKLQKSLYGLKQSPKAWFDRFTTFVKSQEYGQGHFYHTLFTKVSKTGKIAILIVYMDDIVLTVDDQTEISQLKQRMGDEFEIKDLENLKYFLGMEVARSKEGISVSQRKYTFNLLTETDMLGCRPADTPIEFNCKLGNSDDQVSVDKEQYQRLVGKLIYLSHTRPDISFAVSVVSQFMQAPYEKHMETVNRILRYLKNTPGKRSKKQSVVARSSVEAEYKAMSLRICEEIWLQKVLSDLHQECETPLKFFCDNKAAISIANNPVQHDRTKHVEIDRHFIKEKLDSRSICIPYIPSSQQVTDVLTKELLRPHFDLCVSKLGLIDIYVPT
ncbi:Cysteine-rich RLK (receptor-like protein kinase) 8 [Cucumis melo var. makuwa]|uniref:Cysteine-rich RLK (Receptor-like protein kinase) 8 n=1 Tax=Cucumis melo var. makuwa TaxID=1194695 RepID=A0A5D3BH27_CUCMM|nr:Cysteine-rich RLK (receptor-like protein kinase) 8 [Cucumis melo var. makuwa]TYJ97478.1 Cysteine-rich RLK (receptor-like protein kinase) 8 [Cucumis melo var. makuwa]